MTPPPAMRDLDAVFQPHYVYRLYDTNDELIYVGCTSWSTDRPYQHKHKKPARIEVSEQMSCFDAYTEEARAIREQAPRWNRARGHVFGPDIASQEDLEAWASDPQRRAFRESIRTGVIGDDPAQP